MIGPIHRRSSRGNHATKKPCLSSSSDVRDEPDPGLHQGVVLGVKDGRGDVGVADECRVLGQLGEVARRPTPEAWEGPPLSIDEWGSGEEPKDEATGAAIPRPDPQQNTMKPTVCLGRPLKLLEVANLLLVPLHFSTHTYASTHLRILVFQSTKSVSFECEGVS